MPKFRSVYSKITQSFDFNDMPNDFTRLVWVLLPLCLDCEGRGIYNFSWIKSKIFPIREDISDKKLQKAMEWLNSRKNPETKHGMIEIYTVDERQYFWVPTFKTYQRGFEKEAPSILPAPSSNNNSVPTQELLKSESSLNAYTESNAYTEAEVEPSSSVIPVLSSDWQPETPLNYESYKAVEKENSVLLDNIFMGVTSFYPTKDAPACRRAITLICERKNIPLVASNSEKIKDVLRPFFTTWCKRKGQNGNYYSKTNSTWLTEWAVLGEIPAATTGKKEKTVADVIQQQTKEEIHSIADQLRKARQEKGIPVEIPAKVDA